MIEFPTLFVFCLKSFLLGSCIGVMSRVGSRRIVDWKTYQKGWSKSRRPVYEYYSNPDALWFVFGFGIMVAIATALLITSSLAFSALFVFSFGFMLVYSGAIGEIIHPWRFVKFLSLAIIGLVIVVIGIIIFGPLLSVYV